MLPPPECWGHRCMPPCLVYVVLKTKARALLMLHEYSTNGATSQPLLSSFEFGLLQLFFPKPPFISWWLDLIKIKPKSKGWWHMPLILVLWRQRQVDVWDQGLHSELEASQSYLVRLGLKQTTAPRSLECQTEFSCIQNTEFRKHLEKLFLEENETRNRFPDSGRLLFTPTLSGLFCCVSRCSPSGCVAAAGFSSGLPSLNSRVAKTPLYPANLQITTQFPGKCLA